nr:MAG TPA_asm: hypothetical protein [Caudoviricetes sp.]
MSLLVRDICHLFFLVYIIKLLVTKNPRSFERGFYLIISL